MKLGRWLIVVALVAAAAMTSGCVGEDPSGLPPESGQGSATPRWIIFSVRDVTILADQGDGADGLAEFQLYIVATDGVSSAKWIYPADDYVQVAVGQTVSTGVFAPSIDSQAVGDRITVYVLGVDVDDLSFGKDAVGNSLMQAVVGMVVGGFGSPFLDALVGFGGVLAEWEKQADVIGEASFTLDRSAGWGIGPERYFTTPDGGMRIRYQVFGQDTPPPGGGWEGVVTPPPPPQPPQPTQPPPQPQPPQPSSPVGCQARANLSLNVRAGPGEGHSKIGLLDPGELFTITGSNADSSWWEISYAGGTGWVAAKYTTLEGTCSGVPSGGGQSPSQPSGPVAGDTSRPPVANCTVYSHSNLTMRSGPGENFKKIGTLEVGQRGAMIGRDPNDWWWMIEYPIGSGNRGWVSAGYALRSSTCGAIPTVN
jgi:uncharacterized protein YraI